MDISLAIRSITKNRFLLLLGVSALLIAACNPYNPGRGVFLFRSHPYLALLDSSNNYVDSYEYMSIYYTNGGYKAEIRRPDVRVLDQNINKFYDGGLVSFSRDGSTMQAYFNDGYMTNYRIWYYNNRISMEYDIETGTGRSFLPDGRLLTAWLPESTIEYYPDNGMIKEITTDNQIEYYDKNGRLDYYSIRTDSSYREFYNDNSPKSETFYRSNREWEITRYYPNGQIEVNGVMRGGETIGEWIRYDSLGNIEERKVYPE